MSCFLEQWKLHFLSSPCQTPKPLNRFSLLSPKRNLSLVAKCWNKVWGYRSRPAHQRLPGRAAVQCTSGRGNFYPRSFSPRSGAWELSPPPALRRRARASWPQPPLLANFPNITSDCQQSMQKIGGFANKAEMFWIASWCHMANEETSGKYWKSPWEGNVIIVQFGRISGSMMTLMG